MGVPAEATAAAGEPLALAEPLAPRETLALGETDDPYILQPEATSTPGDTYSLRGEETAVPEGAADTYVLEGVVLEEETPIPVLEEEETPIPVLEEETPTPVLEEAKPRPSGDYVLSEKPKREQHEHRYLVANRSEEREPETVAPPDRGWFLFGVFTFPWWPEAISRWAVLCMFFVPGLFVTAMVRIMNSSALLGFLTSYLIAPLVLVWLWVLSYAAGCFVAIIGDTGSGDDEVSNWQDGDWRERIGTLLHVGLHLGLAMAAGFVLTWPVGIFVASELGAVTTAVAANFFFPLFLLSSMEADTLLVPYSPVMLRSLLKTPVGWFIVYIETLVIVATVAASVGLGVFFFPLATALLASPLLATAVFIQARLYGRLAWHIGQTQSKGKKRKRRRQKKDDPKPPRSVRTAVSSKT